MNLNVITEKQVPFSNGSQGADWRESNCERCKKRLDDFADTTEYRCEIQRAIDNAYMTDGTVSSEIGVRMGHSANPIAYVWQCPEVEWSEEWKAEVKRRRKWSYRIPLQWFQMRSGLARWAWKKWTDLVEWRRMPIAHRKADHENGCWAEWCMWAMSMREGRPLENSADKCREEGKCGSCYCGKFCRDET